VLVLLVALLGLSLPAVGAGAPPADRAPQASDGAGPPAQWQVASDAIVNGTVTTEIVVEVRPDADARWIVRTRYRLETENDTRAFRGLVEGLRAGRTDVTRGPELFRNYAEQAEAATGREMNVTGVEYDGTVYDGEPELGDDYQKVGVLTLSFTWTNFAEETDDGRLRIGDAFATPDGGVWLPSLGGDQRIVFVTPEGYGVDRSISSVTDGDRRVIDGPRQFRRGVWFVYGPDEGGPDDSSTPNGDEGLLPGGIDPLLLGGLGVLLVVAGVVAYAVATRDDDGSTPGDGGRPSDGGGGTAVESVQQDDFDLSLLSDEERVEYLLERNGGRMRQAAIVEETGWSDAKVSQLLSAMADDGRINKLRIGRENLISLPDHDPAEEPLGGGAEGDPEEGEGSPDSPTEGTSV
jgi:hypothetical protein